MSRKELPWLRPFLIKANSKMAKGSALIFVHTKRNVTSPISSAKKLKHYTNWNNVPQETIPCSCPIWTRWVSCGSMLKSSRNTSKWSQTNTLTFGAMQWALSQRPEKVCNHLDHLLEFFPQIESASCFIGRAGIPFPKNFFLHIKKLADCRWITLQPSSTPK